MDVGAGSGVFSKLLLDKHIAASARCVDTAYKFDEKLETHNGKHIRFVKAVRDIDESLILMIDILEHLEDDGGFLKEYVDRFPVGSHILIGVPAFSFLWSGHDVFLSHKRRYTLTELEALVNSSGLRILRGRYFFGFLFPIVALIRLRNRILLKKGKLIAKSDLSKPNRYINSLLIAFHVLELKILFPINRLAGLTAFCLAQKI
ncbi:MAG: class I SAM-dependent methyltransferase [Methylococcaceae bacterium]|nr:class I SAM-dependent methyltransferase [Methylococcaceae bacterium]